MCLDMGHSRLFKQIGSLDNSASEPTEGMAFLFWFGTCHYENTPIQIYRQFYHQKKHENFQIKILVFFIFLLKT